MGRKGRKALAPSTLNMLPKLELAPMRMYLTMLAKTLRPSSHALLEHHEVFFQQDQVGGFLGDVGGGIHRDADVGRAQGGCVVDAVAHESDDVAFAAEERG